MSAKCLLRQITNAKLQNLFQSPSFAMLNLIKWMKKLPVTMYFDLMTHLDGEDNFLDYKATKEKVVSNPISDYFDTTPLLLQFIYQSSWINRSRTLF